MSTAIACHAARTRYSEVTPMRESYVAKVKMRSAVCRLEFRTQLFCLLVSDCLSLIHLHAFPSTLPVS